MGQALGTGARGGAIFSRTKYADKELGVAFDDVKGEDAQVNRGKALNNSIQRTMEGAIYLYGKDTSRAQASKKHSAESSKKRTSARNAKGPAPTPSSSIPTWMRGLRRCIVEMAMRLIEGDRIVLVLPTGGFGSGTQQVYEDYRKWAAPSDHKVFFERRGKQHLALPGRVHVNSHGREIVNGMPEGEAIKLIRGYDGISIELDAQEDRPQTEQPAIPEVKWLDILNGDFEIWDYNTRKEPLTDYVSELGEKKKVFCNSAPVIQRLVDEVDGDPLAMMNLLHAVEWFKFKCHKNKKDAAALKRKQTDGGGGGGAIPGGAAAAAREVELASDLGVKFFKDLEEAASEGLESSFSGGWVATTEPVLDVDHWTAELERNLPLNWEATSILVPPSAHTTGQGHRIEAKRHLRFWHFVSAMRTRNDHTLPSVAKIVTLASTGRGFAEGSQHLSVAMRLATTHDVVVKWMKGKYDVFAEKQRQIVRSCLSLSCAFDNWQKFVRNKFQRGHNAAGEERVGTTRFFRRNFEQEWPPKTVLSSPSGESVSIVSTKCIDRTHTSIEYHVAPVGLRHEPFFHQHRLAAAVERERTRRTPGAVTLPSNEWSVASAPGLAQQPPVEYGSQVIPPPLGMTDYCTEGNNGFRRIFDGVPGDGDEVKPMDTGKYYSELSLVQTIGYLHRFVSTGSLWLAGEGGEAKGSQGALQELAGQLRTGMSNITGSYQASAVKQWNKTIDEVALVEWMPMSKFWEMTQEGAADVVVELFEDYGLIVFTDGGKTISHAVGGKTLIIYGDYLSMEHLGSMGVKLLESLGDASKVDNARAILAALEHTHPCPGDLHIPMHKIDEIYRLTYGGFLQAFQAVLRQKRIQMNPIPRYQASRRLAVLVYEQCLRLASQQWSEGLSELEVGGELMPIEAAAEHDASAVILALAVSFDSYLSGLVTSTDAVVSFVGQFVSEMRSFILYEQAVKSGDSVACELILLSWQATMALSGKSKYVELISRWIEAGYGEMTPATLQLQRLNRFLLLSRGKGRIGMDDGCEMLNLWTKIMGGSNDLDAVIIKALFLPLMGTRPVFKSLEIGAEVRWLEI